MTSAAPIRSAFDAHSELPVSGDGVAALISAFQDRLGEVEGWPGFERLESGRTSGTTAAS